MRTKTFQLIAEKGLIGDLAKIRGGFLLSLLYPADGEQRTMKMQGNIITWFEPEWVQKALDEDEVRQVREWVDYALDGDKLAFCQLVEFLERVYWGEEAGI